jgi:hypothetical protein
MSRAELATLRNLGPVSAEGKHWTAVTPAEQARLRRAAGLDPASPRARKRRIG